MIDETLTRYIERPDIRPSPPYCPMTARSSISRTHGQALSQLAAAAGQQQRSAACQRLGAAVVGWQTRNRIVLPSQLLPTIKQHLTDHADEQQLHELTKGLCREILNMAQTPELFRGKSVRIAPNTPKTYLFAEGEKKSAIHINWLCWLELAANSQTIDLLILPPSAPKIGCGTYKEIFCAHNFTLELRQKKGQRKICYSPYILAKIKDRDDLATIERGERFQKELLTKEQAIKLVCLPTPRSISAQLPSPEIAEPHEYKQKWYNCDLYCASKERAVPLDASLKPQKLPFRTKDYFKALIDACESLQIMHNHHIVHGDVKPLNILLQFTNNKPYPFTGYLSDFDFTNHLGAANHISGSYAYWDFAAQTGYLFPSCDLHGLAMSLLELFLGKSIFSWCKGILLSLVKDKWLFDRQTKLTAAKKIIAFYTTSLPSFTIHKMCKQSYLPVIILEINQFRQSAGLFTPAQHVVLQRLEKQLSILDASCELAFAVFQKNMTLYEIIQKEAEKVRAIIQKGTEEEKQLLWEQISTRAACLSMGEFQRKLTAIQQKL